ATCDDFPMIEKRRQFSGSVIKGHVLLKALEVLGRFLDVIRRTPTTSLNRSVLPGGRVIQGHPWTLGFSTEPCRRSLKRHPYSC
ncbi:MAG: hypothetical protein AB8B70_10385, partial [Prochlorococcus sp.]